MLTATKVLATALLASAWRGRPALALATLALGVTGLVSCQQETRQVSPLTGSITRLSEADTLLFSDGATGTLSEEVSGTGQPRASFGAHAYGGTRFDTSSEERKFAGTPRDGGVGVDLMGARAYLPELGVFASVDPLRLSEPERLVMAHPSASAYAYANNNPLVQVDRDGEFAWLAAAAVVVGVAFTTQYANAPESPEMPLQHKGWGEQALDMLHNAASVYGAARLVGALPAMTRTLAAGDVGTALHTTATVAKAGAAAEIAGQAADAVDRTGTTRKVVEIASALSMKSVKAPRPPPRAKPEPLKEYFKTLNGGGGADQLPALMNGPGDKMLGQAVGHLRNMPAAQRVAAFEKYAGQITEATSGQWSAKPFNAINGRVFAGEGGEALVFDSAGNMFRGNLADRDAFAFREGGQIEVIFNALRSL